MRAALGILKRLGPVECAAQRRLRLDWTWRGRLGGPVISTSSNHVCYLQCDAMRHCCETNRCYTFSYTRRETGSASSAPVATASPSPASSPSSDDSESEPSRSPASTSSRAVIDATRG